MNSVIPTKTEIVDLLWRAFWTGSQAFIGGLLAAGSGVVNISALDAGKIAAIGAVLSLIKTFASNKVGTGTSGSQPAPAGLPQPVASNYAIPV